jgi:hypothetical protein
MQFKIFIFIILFGILSCKKQPKAEIQGSITSINQPVYGIVKGNVGQVDQYYNLYRTGLNTTTVSILGIGLSAVTDSAGNFSISHVPPGVYDFSFNKPNCGNIQMQQVTCPGEGTFYLSDTIHEKANFIFNSLVIRDTFVHIENMPTNHTLSVKKVIVSFDVAKFRRAALVIFGKDSALEISRPDLYTSYRYISIPDSVSSHFFLITSKDYPYARIYPNAVGTNGAGYLNVASNRYVFSNVGSSYPVILKLK